MTDDAELEGLDPFDLFDEEATRLEVHLQSLPADQWSRPSRCEGWSVRDVVAHLAASEAYNRACLTGEVTAFLADLGAQGVTDLDSANALGIAQLAGRSNEQLVEQWRADNAFTRERFRERGDGTLDTAVGAYPIRWQAFHLANELAVHADDIDVPLTDAERNHRLAWRARFSRFVLAEAKPALRIERVGDNTRVRGDSVDVTLDDPALVAAVAGRAGPESALDPEARALLSIQ